jgi:hypothetical protein
LVQRPPSSPVILTRERLRRAKIGLDLLARLLPEAVMSPLPSGSRATLP